MGRTVDNLVAFLYGIQPLSAGAAVDFALDGYDGASNAAINRRIAKYKELLEKEVITANELHRMAGDSYALTRLLETPVKTAWDDIWNDYDYSDDSLDL